MNVAGESLAGESFEPEEPPAAKAPEAHIVRTTAMTAATASSGRRSSVRAFSSITSPPFASRIGHGIRPNHRAERLPPSSRNTAPAAAKIAVSSRSSFSVETCEPISS